ncbi:Alpha/Beta hydrolase protein [Papiliotrema laurentii]|uniref:Alpha/Beta hydrolase protein n=1 Tax=Papiliotrema laurentii TaxID=5418 RepID=A0AAD9CVA3_PAPLA|nr:Alpha/Beta hydrolase protein [Papiliotrema laurentii]
MSPIPESTDYPSLRLGHPTTSCTSVNIVGLDVKVYGLDEVKHSSLPLAAVIATHGRCNNQKQMAHLAHGLLGHISVLAQDHPRTRDVIVVTVDQRNHGDRTVDRTANLAYDKNPNHLVDMAACVVGGCHDVSFIIDFLGSYLFPEGNKRIDEWIATGISLGGNLTYRLLQIEPRINIAIPIIGLPWDVFRIYLQARAESMGLAFSPPLYPPALRPILESTRPDGCYKRKKILSIHGSIDNLVPYDKGERQIKQAQREAKESGGEMEIYVQEGAGHVVTPEMIEKTAEWVWRWAVKGQQGRM